MTENSSSIGVLLVAGYTTKGRWWEWVPASYQHLERVERKILERSIETPFEMTKVARLGTVIVPCSDKAKVASGNVKNLVMVHGFASGNAFWATVRAPVSIRRVYCASWRPALTRFRSCALLPRVRCRNRTEPRRTRQALQRGACRLASFASLSVMKPRPDTYTLRLVPCICSTQSSGSASAGRIDQTFHTKTYVLSHALSLMSFRLSASLTRMLCSCA